MNLQARNTIFIGNSVVQSHMIESGQYYTVDNIILSWDSWFSNQNMVDSVQSQETLS